MADRGVYQGKRSRVDPAGRFATRRPRSEVPVPQIRARYARDCSPHAYGQRYRRSRRGNGRY
jgi:hypothetical protein